MDLDKEKKKAGQIQFLADRYFLPANAEGLDEDSNHYVTAMLPPKCYLDNAEENPDDNYHCLHQYEDICYDNSLVPLLDGFVCEEVILYRAKETDKLGLTLYYSSTDGRYSEVYVGEIEEGSVAAGCKGLQLGDQVLQVNYMDVYSRSQVVQLFDEGGLQVHMLVARSACSQLGLMVGRDSEDKGLADRGLAERDLVDNAQVERGMEKRVPVGTIQEEDDDDDDENYEKLQLSGAGDVYGVEDNDSGHISNGTMDRMSAHLGELELSDINLQLDQLRSQCLYLETIRQMKLQMAPPQSTTTGATLNGPTKPRMGTRLPATRTSIPLTDPLKPPPPDTSPPPLSCCSSSSDYSQPYVIHTTAPTTTAPTNSHLTLKSSQLPPYSPLVSNRKPLTKTHSSSSNSAEVPTTQWVMKIRHDGSKYFVKRPITRKNSARKEASTTNRNSSSNSAALAAAKASHTRKLLHPNAFSNAAAATGSQSDARVMLTFL